MNAQCLPPPATTVVVPMGRVELTFADLLKAVRQVEKTRFFPELQDVCHCLKRNPSLLHNFNVDFRRLGIWGLALPSEPAKFEQALREYIRHLQAGDATRKISIRDLADVMCIKDAHSFDRKARELGVDLRQFPITDEGLTGGQKVKPFHPFFKKYQAIRREYVHELGSQAREDFRNALARHDNEALKSTLIRLKRIRGKNDPLLVEYYRAQSEKRPMREAGVASPKAATPATPAVAPVENRTAIDFALITKLADHLNAALAALHQAGQLRHVYRLEFQHEPALQYGGSGSFLRGWRAMEGGFSQTIAIDRRRLFPRVKEVLEDLQKKVVGVEGNDNAKAGNVIEQLKWKNLRSEFAIIGTASGAWSVRHHVRDQHGHEYASHTAEVRTPGELCEALRAWKKKSLLPQYLLLTYTDYDFSAFKLAYPHHNAQLVVKDLSDSAEVVAFLGRCCGEGA